MTPLAAIFPSKELALLTLMEIAGGIYLFVRGFRLLARKRLLMNTPTSKIRSASLGLVEVSGLANGPYTLPAPITGVPCYLYRTTAWQKNDESRSGEWKKAAEETLHVPFFLDDTTGQLLIEPMGADLELHTEFKQDFSDTVFSPHATGSVLSFLARHGIQPSNKIRIEECSIQPQTPLFVVGTLTENPGIAVRPFSATLQSKSGRPAEDRPFQAGPPPEVVRLSDSSTEAQSRDRTQQSKIAAALSKAGITSPAAWKAAGVPYQAQENVPRVSEMSIKRQDSRTSPTQEITFDLNPPVVLMKGTNNPTFLISFRSQKEVVSAISWKCAAMIWGGAAMVLLGTYMLLS